jgi:hypothetical protein
MLFDNTISMRKYVLRAGLISLVPSLMVLSVLATTGVVTDQNSPRFEGSRVGLLLTLVVIGPPIETFLVVPILRILSFCTRREVPLAAMSACVWAGLHSLMAPAWGLGVIWPFFVFSCSYLTWRRRGFWHAVLATSCVHALQNLVPAIVAAATQ